MTSTVDNSSLEIANKLLQQGKIQEAVAEYRRGIELTPDLSWHHYYLGEALTQLEDWEGAVSAYRQAISLGSNYLCYYRLGVALVKLERWDEAIEVLNQGLELKPDYYKFYLPLGQALVHQQHWEPAMEAYRKAVALKPGVAEFNLQLGYLLRRHGRFQEAAGYLQRAVDFQGDDPQLQLALGVALVEGGTDLDRAEGCLRRSLELQPDQGEAYFYLGKLCQGRDQLQDALGFYRRCGELSPGVDSALAVAAVLEKLGRWTEAVDQYRQVVLEFGECGPASLGLGRALAELERPVEAVVEWRRAVKLGVETPEVHRLLAETLVELGRWSEVVEHWKWLLERYPGAVDWRRRLALALMGLGRWTEAAAQWGEYWRVAPGSGRCPVVDFRPQKKTHGEIDHSQELSITGDLTVEFWLYLRDWPKSWTEIISKCVSDEQNEFCFRLKDDQKGQWYYGKGEAFAKPINWVPQEDMRLHEWVHVACVRKVGQYGRIYFNGVLRREADWSGESEAVGTEAPVRLMASTQWQRFQDGKLSEVRLWNRALSGDEIREGMCEGLTGEEPGLVGLWHGDESDEGVLVDAVGHHHGRLVMAADAGKERPRVGVCGWELSHNAAGRAYTLAQLYGGFAEVELIGCLFPKYGGQVWEPIRGGEIRCHTIRVENEGRFIEQALGLVLAHPYEVVHLSKPRMPNIILGLLYKLVWGARVIVDIDDEELAFVKASEPLDLAELLESGGKLPPFQGWDGGKWTRLAVGLARAFDGVTVANRALQERYGGVVIRHGRDEARFVPSDDRKRGSRERFGIAQDKKVVLFFGTPRKHKGLVTTARALGSLGRKDVVFAIIGDFEDGKLKEELQGIPGVDYVFVGNQPFESIPDVVAVGDICVLLQDADFRVSQFQIPAKLSDALGMGLVVLLSETAAVADVIESGAVVPVAEGDLPAVLDRVLSDEAECNKFRVRGRELLAAEFGFGVNGSRLAEVMDEVRSGVGVLSDELNLLLAGFPAVGSVWSEWVKQNFVENAAVLKAGRVAELVMAQPDSQVKHSEKLNLFSQKLSPYRSLQDLSRTIKKPNQNQVTQDKTKVTPVFENQSKVQTIDIWENGEAIDCQGLLVSIIIYADQPGSLLRLTLEAINSSIGIYEYELHIICDWEQNQGDFYTQGSSPKIKVHQLKSKEGFYKSISRIIKSCEASSCLILRAGVIVSPQVISELIHLSIIRGDYDILSPLTTNTPFLSIPIKAGESYLSTSRFLKLLNGDNSSLSCPVPSLEIFMINRNAIKLLPFPHWSLEQDQTVTSLVRYFTVLRSRGARLGLSLNSFAVSLSRKLIEDEKIEDLIENKYKNQFKLDLDKYVIDATNILKKYNDIRPIIVAKTTICFLLQSFKLGGGCIVICNLANHLLLLGFNVKVFAKHLSTDYQVGFNLLFTPQLYSSLDQILDETLVGTIYVATLWTTARDVEALVYRKSRSVGLYFIQDYEVRFYDPKSDRVAERSYWQGALDSYSADLIKIYTSDWIKSQLVQGGHLGEKGTFKVNVGIDHSLYPPRNSRADSLKKSSAIVIGAMARPSTPRRGFPLLISSLKLIKKRHPSVEIVLFGEDELSQYGIHIDFEYRLEGKVEPIKLASLYQKLDIFLDTSEFQGFGLCPLEAMSAGCACVLTDSGGILEYAVNGENSIIVTHDPEAIASAVSCLIADNAKRLAISNNAIETSKRFDISQTTQKWIEIIENVRCQPLRYLRPSCVVVVPVYNKISVARRCIESVISTLRANDELIVIDDASDSYTASELQSYEVLNCGVKILRNHQNLGFVGSANRGMEYARDVGKDVVLLNSDTIVVDGWIQRLEESAFSGLVPAVVSPMSTESSHLYVRLNPGDSFRNVDCWLQENHKSRQPEIITPEGWCIFIPREVYQKIGFLDHVFGRGYCEESDFCMRAYAAGFPLKSCDNLIVYHQGKVTFGKERSSLYQNNRRIFDRRWSHIYDRLYKDFLRKDPLSSLRLHYKWLSETPEIKSYTPYEFDYLINILDDEDVQFNLKFVKNLIASRNSETDSVVTSLVVLLPEFLPYGGVLSVVSLVNSLILQGIEAKIVVLNSKGFQGDELGSLTKPMFLMDRESIVSNFPNIDLIVATSWITVYYAAMVISKRPWMSLAYYIQDYEADFPDVRESSRLREACLLTYQLGIPAFCKTEWIRDKVIQSGGSNVKIVPPALDIDTFYRQHTRWQGEHCHVLGMYRPSTPQRDPETLLATFALIKKLRPNTIIWVFGSDSIPEDLLKSGLIDRNLGGVANTDLPVVYSSADIFLETSIFHGFGRTIAEAMACQTACVITNSGGPTMFAKDGYNCIMRPPKDVEGLAKAVVSLLNDGVARSHLSDQGRLSVQAFDPKKSSQAIAKILNIK
ncbi:MAG: glycosyltransferase [Limnospira sp. PMC 1286.21]|uniref:glycosyltransferase n=1 Tax=Limnospira sp. PMC 1286.21 TaxID=2981069 RepID=UPI0028E12D5D|nr:glycosyltransferase [Limnospira sp. PMC 1286.21]MDT9327727.1 glycosyltransferase [Limnospira sp. PMC 1286.21]